MAYAKGQVKVPFQINSKQPDAEANVFVVRHIHLPNFKFRLILKICFGSRHDAIMKILFLQLHKPTHTTYQQEIPHE